MRATPIDPTAAIAEAVEDYRVRNDYGALLERLLAIAGSADAETLVAAVEPYREIPEVAGPIYERVVEQRPDDSRALVILANAYWLTGRGPDATGELASRALAADPGNRGAWHLWALTESDQRARAERWQQVVDRFPDDDLARANMADNLASVASAEGDPAALERAIAAYETLRRTATHPEQREALDRAITTLKSWDL